MNKILMLVLSVLLFFYLERKGVLFIHNCVEEDIVLNRVPTKTTS